MAERGRKEPQCDRATGFLWFRVVQLSKEIRLESYIHAVIRITWASL